MLVCQILCYNYSSISPPTAFLRPQYKSLEAPIEPYQSPGLLALQFGGLGGSIYLGGLAMDS